VKFEARVFRAEGWGDQKRVHSLRRRGGRMERDDGVLGGPEPDEEATDLFGGADPG
jgi:hypothetical protein